MSYGITQLFGAMGPAEFERAVEANPKAYVLDVRTPQEYAEGHLPGAHNLDWLDSTVFKAGASMLPKGSTIYVYCRSGKRSAEAACYLSSLGYKVVDMAGGYLGWKNR